MICEYCVCLEEFCPSIIDARTFKAVMIASKLRAGNINLNGAGQTPNLPFGGYKKSGNGREWGAHGFADYLEIKAVAGFEE